MRLASGKVVQPGRLYRSDAPYPGDAIPEVVPTWPPRTVIDLRSPGETQDLYLWPREVRVHRVPLSRQAAMIGAADGQTAPPPALPASLSALYRHIIETMLDRLAELVGLGADANGPILVHCAAGKDRTGIAVAVLLLVGGAEPDAVAADYVATQANMTALFDRLAALGRSLPALLDPDSELLRAPAEAIGIVLERLTEWRGGPRGWAQAHGASADQVSRWQDYLAT
jgi:rhodanese-related sulfurtransferase